MQVTIDSSESLSDVLRLIGSVYGTTLTVAESAPRSTAARRPAKRAAGTKLGTTPKRGGHAATGRGGKVDPKLVRQWAWENGHEVNARGSLPAAVREAYLAANPS